jgi:hypothetical protein
MPDWLDFVIHVEEGYKVVVFAILVLQDYKVFLMSIEVLRLLLLLEAIVSE